MRRLSLFCHFLASLLVGVGAVAAYAQAGSGTIVGTITDPSGAVIPSVSVKVVDQNTGTVREVQSNAQGYYVAPSLAPSVYSITASSNGFAQSKHTNVTLLADQHLTVDLQMKLASSSQTVSVSSVPPVQVDTSSSTLSQVVEQKRIVDLPLNGRNPVQLALLVPGTTQAPANNSDQGQYKTLPVAITISTNGSRNNETAFNLDGSSNNDIYTNVNQPFPFPDALQEFSVQTSDYTARYGGNSGAVVNAISKGGTNQFHGDLFEFNRNAVFNAANYFSYSAKTNSKTVDPLKRNQFGGVLGGPIIHNKLFFFGGYQQTQIRDVQNGKTAIVPTAAELNGDFSAVSQQIYNPATGAAYQGNQIDPKTFDQAAVKFVTNYLPQSSSSNGQIVYALPLSQSFNEYIVRGDETLSQNDHLFARYYLDKYNDNPFLDPSNYLSLVSYSQIYSHNAIIGETHTFTPNLLNDFRLSFSRVTTNAGPPTKSISVADLGVAVTQPANFAKALDGISVSGYFNANSSFPPSIMNRTNYIFADDISWIHGKHSFAFGGMIGRGQTILRDAYLAGGTFSFTADNTASPAGGGGNAMASFLLGSMREFKQGNGEFKDDRDWVTALYAQDDYHVTKKLTVNLGVRWAPFVPWYEVNGRVEQFRAANYYAGIKSTQFTNAPAGLLFPGDPGMPKYGVTSTKFDFSPRVGFALDPTGKGRTSIRGGLGVFYDSQQVGIENNRFVDVSPFSTQIDVVTPQGSFSNPYLGMTNPFPAPAVPSKDSVFPAPVLAVSYDPAHNSRMLPPVTYNYNLTVQHQFPDQFLAGTSYVGSLSRHQTETIELNPAVYTAGSKLSTDQRRIFQGFGSIGQGTDDLNSNYNGLQISLQRRMNTVTLLGNYTFSKTLDDVPAGQGNAGIASQSDSALPWTNPDRHKFDYGPADFDHHHILNASYVWDLPQLRNRNLAERLAAGGWQTTGIINYQSGYALTALAGSDRSQTGLGRDRAMQISPDVYGGNGCAKAGVPCVNYLNPAAYVTNYTATSFPLGSAGNAGKGAVRGPGFVSWDAGLMKNFAINERAHFQFHAEYFNVLNHTNLGNPNMTANSQTFGAIQGANDPRIGQLALKLIF
jgi:hypothetical protein